MNFLFKTLAALVAAFTLFASSAFAGTIVGCQMEGGVPKKVVSYSADEMSRAFLDHRGARTMVSGTFTGFTNCNDALVSIGLKKPAEKKAEVKVLGGRPNIQSPEKHLGKTYEYCKDGQLHTLSIVPGKVFDNSFSEKCVLDTSKTLVLTGIVPTELPAEPTVAEIKNEIIKQNIPPYDGMGDFCKNGSPWVAYATAQNNGKTYKISTYASTSKDPCTVGKARFRLELVEPHD